MQKQEMLAGPDINWASLCPSVRVKANDITWPLAIMVWYIRVCAVFEQQVNAIRHTAYSGMVQGGSPAAISPVDVVRVPGNRQGIVSLVGFKDKA